MLWVELPEGFDNLKLNRVLMEQGVQIAVGSIFLHRASTGMPAHETTLPSLRRR